MNKTTINMFDISNGNGNGNGTNGINGNGTNGNGADVLEDIMQPQLPPVGISMDQPTQQEMEEPMPEQIPKCGTENFADYENTADYDVVEKATENTPMLSAGMAWKDKINKICKKNDGSINPLLLSAGAILIFIVIVVILFAVVRKFFSKIPEIPEITDEPNV